MNNPNDAPKIHIDSDWKVEAEQEKARLAEQDAAEAEHQALGQPTFMHVVNMFAMQATVAMGGMQGPEGEAMAPDPELARFHIDMLAVLEEKTKGNLTTDEAKVLASVLNELRMIYIEVMRSVSPSPKP